MTYTIMIKTFFLTHMWIAGFWTNTESQPGPQNPRPNPFDTCVTYPDEVPKDTWVSVTVQWKDPSQNKYVTFHDNTVQINELGHRDSPKKTQGPPDGVGQPFENGGVDRTTTAAIRVEGCATVSAKFTDCKVYISVPKKYPGK